MKFQNLFSWKNEKKYFKMLSAEIFTQSAKHSRSSVDTGFIFFVRSVRGMQK